MIDERLRIESLLQDAVTPSLAVVDWLTGLPWLLMVLLLSPLLISALRHGKYPRPRAIVPIVAPVVFSLLLIWRNEWLGVVLFLDALIVSILLADFLTLPSLEQMEASREMPKIGSLGAPLTVNLLLENHGHRRTLRGRVRDDLPTAFTAEPDELEFELPPLSRLKLAYRLTPQRRGHALLTQIHFNTFSRWGLWQQFTRIPHESHVSVYPDIRQLAEYALLARTDRLSLIGVRTTRKVGQDNEFERLRDYSRDDNYRHIDWRSTARRNRLTVRQFQSDQSQRLLIMLDCGRMMTNEYRGYSLLDYAMNASLMLAYVALKQGDAVGLLCFSDRVHTYVPPRSGHIQTNRMLHACYDQFPQLVESRYDQAFLYLTNHCRRRTLVVLFTNVIDQVNADQVQDYLGNLAGRHLPVAVAMRDRAMFDLADNPGQDPTQLYRSAAAAEILNWRHQTLSRLRHRGALIVDAFPDEISAPLVNRYLEVKAKHLL